MFSNNDISAPCLIFQAAHLLGFYLLALLGPNRPIGGLTAELGLSPLPFTFRAPD
ncbi:hypothetical protein [Methylomicrobium sp. Wu6]|uniref:hypothetical protein n=1 Tax=Methylomicrobium sp. Wu6 TaxID=3107928 RepID=UPI002DD66521|nr:hypothetical protein [Methylomicrobium sp. Wu6]MEC4749177.1 hypothetical protein [Methylomicrobium sp. Wu6]